MRNFLFISVLIFYLALNLYVGWRMLQLLPAGRILLRAIAMGLVATGALGMFLFFLWGESMPVCVASFFYSAGTSWLIALVYLSLAFLLIDSVKLANLFLHFVDKEIFFSFTHRNWKMLLAVLSCVGLLLFAGNLNYRHKKRVYLPIESDGWDVQAKPLRIVAVSDLHLGYTISEKELTEWVGCINAEKPDVVLIGGDLIDNALRPLMRYALYKKLRELRAPMGVYGCPGNHEFLSGIEKSAAFYEKAGIVLLRDSVAELENVRIIGRDDCSNKSRKSLREIERNSEKRKFTILLDHQPHNLDDAVSEQIDFQFSGHTHRGQIFPFSLITDNIYELSHGYLKKGNSHFYVSSGLGIWGGKFRIGTQSEYVVIEVAGRK